jgi:hypothetical protein
MVTREVIPTNTLFIYKMDMAALRSNCAALHTHRGLLACFRLNGPLQCLYVEGLLVEKAGEGHAAYFVNQI